jgi:hypothetical protein
MEEEFLDSSDEEKDFCDEKVKPEGILFNEAKIFRYLLFKQQPTEIDYAATIRDWLSIGTRDYTDRASRTGEIRSKYLERKKAESPLSPDEARAVGEKLLEIFTPIITLKFPDLVIKAKEAKTLFCWLFNSRVKLPNSLEKSSDKVLNELKAQLLDPLQLHLKSDKKGLIWKFAKNALKSHITHNLEGDTDRGATFISSVLYEARKIKDLSKAFKISNQTIPHNLQSTLEMDYFDLAGSKGHHTVINPSLNSCSKIPAFTTYKKLLKGIPTKPKELRLFTDCIFNFISSQSWEPKDVSSDVVSDIKGVAAEFVQSFFVESVRNPNTILIFPMWLELLHSNPKVIFPMSKVGAVANSRQLMHDYGYLLYQPFLLDYDQKNAKDSKSLLDLEASILIDWLKFERNIDISDMLLRASHLTKLVTYSAKSDKKLTCNDILSVHESVTLLGGSGFLTKKEITTLSLKKSLVTVDPKNLIMGKYQGQLDSIKELIKQKEQAFLKEQVEFLKQIFATIEESFSKWYNIEVPDELKITREHMDYYDQNILAYLCKPVDEFSPFKLKPPMQNQDLSQIIPKKLSMDEDEDEYDMRASESPTKRIKLEHDQDFHDHTRNSVFGSREEFEVEVLQSPNAENQLFNTDFPEYPDHKTL